HPRPEFSTLSLHAALPIYVAPAVDRRDVERVGEAVEGERAGERDHVPAVDQPLAEAALRFGELVEVHARRILVEPGGERMLGLRSEEHTSELQSQSNLVCR